jgi:hypothetical protein
LLTFGWHHIEWLSNPVISLSGLLSGPANQEEFGAFGWARGLGVLVILIVVIWKQARNLWIDFLGRTLLIAIITGFPAGDQTWSVMALTICLYWGLPLLLPTNSTNGFFAQRGMALLLLFVLSTTFMLADKSQHELILSGYLSPRDNLIKSLAENTNFGIDATGQSHTKKKPIRVASQWPGLTMLACKCDALPLPPPAKDSETLLAMLRSFNYLIFDPRDTKNSSLSQNLASVNAGKFETIALQKGGVIIEIKDPTPELKL